MSKEYTANDIETLSFKTAIRTKISMYLGSADNQGVLQGIREIISNSIDEAIMGYGEKIVVDIYEGNRVRVEDFARGAPFGKREDGTEALEAIYMSPHSGGKFSNKTYESVIGAHGSGAKCVALSSDVFTAESYRDGSKATLKINKGDKESFLVEKEKRVGSGTIVEYIPSQEVFYLEPIKIDFEEVKQMCQDWAFLNKGLEFVLTNHVTNEKVTYKYVNGILDLLKSKVKKPIHPTPVYGIIQDGDIVVEVAAQWTLGREESFTYTNALLNPEGGTSLTGFRTSVTRNMKKLCGLKTGGEMARQGLVYVISSKIPNPSFSNQTKTKVNNPELRTLADRAFNDAINKFSLLKPKEFEKITEFLNKNEKAEVAAERARRAILGVEKELNDEKHKRTILGSTLKDCRKHGPDSGSILMVMEGKSALGSIAQGRDINYSALLPIRGKIISALKHDPERILQNEEVKAIVSALGTGIYGKYNSKKLRYQYLGITTDADVDGYNIGTLIITLLYHIMPEFLKEGRLVWVNTPLFVLSYKDGDKYAFTEQEKTDLIKQYGNPRTIARKKGLGELTPEDTKNGIFGEQKRWNQLIVNDLESFEKTLEMLMGKDVPPRKNFIMQNVNFNEVTG